MTTLNAELLSQIQALTASNPLPRVRQLILPGPQLPGDTKYSKFGLLELEDESCGFFYRLSEFDSKTNQKTLSKLHDRAAALAGQNPADVAQGLTSADEMDIGLGIAAINAITHHVFQKNHYAPAQVAQGSAELPAWAAARHLGMVGYFAPTVNYLKQAGIPVTVIELDVQLHGKTDGVLVTGDISELSATDHIICTASTILNGSLEGLLNEFATGRFFELVGPTCGCFADGLFARGVDLIGSSHVVDIGNLRSRIVGGHPWKDSVRKYQISPTGYPGFEALLANMN